MHGVNGDIEFFDLSTDRDNAGLECPDVIALGPVPGWPRHRLALAVGAAGLLVGLAIAVPAATRHTSGRPIADVVAITPAPAISNLVPAGSDPGCAQRPAGVVAPSTAILSAVMHKWLPAFATVASGRDVDAGGVSCRSWLTARDAHGVQVQLTTTASPTDAMPGMAAVDGNVGGAGAFTVTIVTPDAPTVAVRADGRHSDLPEIPDLMLLAGDPLLLQTASG